MKVETVWGTPWVGGFPISVDSTRLNSQARLKKAPGAASKWKATDLDMEN